MKILGNIISLVGLWLVWVSWQFSRQDGGLLIASVGGVIGLLVSSAGQHISSSAMRDQHEESNAVAKTIVDELDQKDAAGENDAERGSSRRFALYLRPFQIDGKFATDTPKTGAFVDVFQWEQYDRAIADGLERVISDACAKTAPLIGLGSPEEGFGGVGIAGTFDDWQARIQKAIDEAYIIFMVPAPNAGTLWEVGQVFARNAAWKTMFIMPSTSGAFSFTDELDYAAYWEQARQATKTELGIDLPSYRKSGALFRWGPDRRLIVSALNAHTPRGFARDVNAAWLSKGGRKLTRVAVLLWSVVIAVAYVLPSISSSPSGGEAYLPFLIVLVAMLTVILAAARWFVASGQRKFRQQPRHYFDVAFLSLLSISVMAPMLSAWLHHDATLFHFIVAPALILGLSILYWLLASFAEALSGATNRRAVQN